jgi:hypothetical protein
VSSRRANGNRFVSPLARTVQRLSRHGARPASRRAQQRDENRRLRNVVQRDQGCLSSLDGTSQHLLSLRAGLHGAPRNPGAVARILGISTGREQLLESMSLLMLQRTAAGGCGGTTTVSAGGTPQLASAAPWVTQSGSTAPVATGAGSSSPSSGAGSATGSGSPAPVRSGGARSVNPIVISPAATRTVERAATDENTMSPTVIVLFALLVLAVALVLVPGVRRRLLPTLAGLPSADGHGQTRVTSLVTPTAPPADVSIAAGAATAGAALGAEPDILAPEAAAPQAAAPQAVAPAPQPVAPAPQPEPAATDPSPFRSTARVASQSAPTAVPQPQPEVQRPRLTWAREHATQGALAATVIAGGLARALKRGRGH